MTSCGTTAERRRRAARAGHTGDVETVRGLVTDSDPSVRAAALRAMDRLGRIDELELTVDPDEPAAWSCAIAELAPGLRDPLPMLRELLVDSRPEVLDAAAHAVGELGVAGAPLLDRVIELTDHPDPLVRETAVAALGAIGDPRAVSTVLARLDDVATVRRRAVIALAPFDGDAVAAALARAATDRDWQVRQAAEDLLDDGDAQPPLRS